MRKNLSSVFRMKTRIINSIIQKCSKIDKILYKFCEILDKKVDKKVNFINEKCSSCEIYTVKCYDKIFYGLNDIIFNTLDHSLMLKYKNKLILYQLKKEYDFNNLLNFNNFETFIIANTVKKNKNNELEKIETYERWLCETCTKFCSDSDPNFYLIDKCFYCCDYIYTREQMHVKNCKNFFNKYKCVGCNNCGKTICKVCKLDILLIRCPPLIIPHHEYWCKRCYYEEIGKNAKELPDKETFICLE